MRAWAFTNPLLTTWKISSTHQEWRLNRFEFHDCVYRLAYKKEERYQVSRCLL